MKISRFSKFECPFFNWVDFGEKIEKRIGDHTFTCIRDLRDGPNKDGSNIVSDMISLVMNDVMNKTIENEDA